MFSTLIGFIINELLSDILEDKKRLWPPLFGLTIDFREFETNYSKIITAESILE